MVEGNIFPRLCGGTFFTLLLRARKEPQEYRKSYPSDNDNHRKRDMLAALIKLASPNYEKPMRNSPQDKSLGSITTRYAACEISKSVYLPFTDFMVIKGFDSRIKDENDYQATLKEMQEFTLDFLEADSSQLVKELLELVYLDTSINDDEMFYIRKNGQPIKKSALMHLLEGKPPALHICLPAFLLGIWHFIIVNRTDNKIGASTFNSWHKESNISGQEKEYIGTIGSNINIQIEFIAVDAEWLDTYTFPAIEPTDSSTSTISSIEEKLDIEAPSNNTVAEKTNGVSKIHIPKEFKRCVYCQKWDGNREHAKKVQGGTYGLCMLYNKNQLSTSGGNCPDFDPDSARIACEVLYSKAKNNMGSPV